MMFRRVARALVPGSIRRAVQKRKLDAVVSQFERRVVEHTYDGVRLNVELADPLAAGWYDHDWSPLAEMAVLARGRLRSGARVFDVGAHQGVVGLILADRVGHTGTVVLVEPNSHNVTQCKRNALLNGKDWITTERAAIAERDGTIWFNNGLNGAAAEISDYGGVVEVPAITLDSLVAKYGPPDVVVLDVEGFECRALAGAEVTFTSDPDWFVEVHVGCGLEAAGGSVSEVLRHFPARRFERFVHAEGDDALPLETASPALFRERFFLTALARRDGLPR